MPKRALATIACLATLLAAGSDADSAEDDRDIRTISVAGTGKISAAPDVAEINVGVVTQGSTARDALGANNEAMTSLQGVLKERGVAAKDIQTTSININPQYSQPPPPQPPNRAPEPFVPKIVGYEVQNMVRITAREISKLGPLLDAVVTAGANQMHGISFRIDVPDALQDQARKEAVADARRKAELLAGEAGVVLGRPLSIREEGALPPPAPYPPMMGRMMAAAAPVPVAAGEQELSVTVHIVYELLEPK